MNYLTMNKNELLRQKDELQKEYDSIKSKGLHLDMSRGKPSRQQVRLSMPLLQSGSGEDWITTFGEDCCNYGVFDGIREMKEIFAELLGVPAKNVFVGGNSSLNMMFDVISQYMVSGVCKGQPWINQGEIKFLCPAPGYDRHFAILEYFKIQPIVIPMTHFGPDMDMVESLVSQDETIKGIWCVPKYSNPQGITYSDETVKRFAKLAPKANDFRIFWDNAYAVHFWDDEDDKLLNLYEECLKAKNEDLPIIFTSTSKITIPGAGVAALAASNQNLSDLKARYKIQTIGYDKVNQLRHVQFLKNSKGIREHMSKQKAELKPKFELVYDILKREFSDNSEIVSFERSHGGYFVSVDVMNGCAKKIVKLCKDAGLVLTDAGATYPGGKDPKDRNIRLAPSYPELNDLRKAMNLFCICVKLAAIDKIINRG